MTYKDYLIELENNKDKLPLLKTFKSVFSLSNVNEDNRSIRFLKSNNLLDHSDKFLYDKSNKRLLHINNYGKYIISYFVINLNNFGKIDDIITFHQLLQEMNLYYINEKIDYISNIFNICNIDINTKINVFNDGINYLLINNSIFTKTLFKTYILFDKELLFYYFSNNKYGEELFNNFKKLGYNVFDWKNFLKHYSLRNRIYDIHSLNQYKDLSNFNLKKFF